MAMRIALCFPVLLMAGCCGSPQTSVLQCGGKEASVGRAHGRLYMAVVTDGTIGSSAVVSGLFVRPRFMGTLNLGDQCLPYSARGHRLSIGDNNYDLTKGRLFAVSLASEPPTIRQIDLSESKMVKTFLENDAELMEFFRDTPSTK